MIGGKKRNTGAVNEYQEESLKSAIYITLAVLAIVAAPLGLLIQRIDAEGFRLADTTQHQDLAEGVELDVKTVRRMLEHELVDESQLKGINSAMITLITPGIMSTNMGESVGSKKLKVVLKGIYWSPKDPLVTIGERNYRIGEMIQGHRIVEIRKTEVVFEDAAGEKVIKYFYDYLDNP